MSQAGKIAENRILQPWKILHCRSHQEEEQWPKFQMTRSCWRSRVMKYQPVLWWAFETLEVRSCHSRLCLWDGQQSSLPLQGPHQTERKATKANKRLNSDINITQTFLEEWLHSMKKIRHLRWCKLARWEWWSEGSRRDWGATKFDETFLRLNTRACFKFCVWLVTRWHQIARSQHNQWMEG